jgi:hypothetical protein
MNTVFFFFPSKNLLLFQNKQNRDMKKRKEAPPGKTPQGTHDLFWVGVGVIGMTMFLLQLQLYEAYWEEPFLAGDLVVQSNEVLLSDFARNPVTFSLLAAVPYSSLGSVLTEEQVAEQIEALHHESFVAQQPPPPSSSSLSSLLFPSEDPAFHRSENPMSSARNIKLSLHVFCWKRQQSQDRLFASLLHADYLFHKVDLHIHIDGGHPSEVALSAQSLVWPFGSKFVHPRRGQPLGLPQV